METIQDKEAIIVGTIINCNQVIKKFLNETSKKPTKLFESHNNDIYNFTMKKLYSKIAGDNTYPTYVEFSPRNNYYAYFKKTQEFLNGYEPSLQNSLNESLVERTEKPKIYLDIYSFRQELKQLVEYLSKQNDLENYSSYIVNIKTFSKQPMFVNGYNICNNIALMNELQSSFGILQQDVIAVCFNKSTKQIYFVTNNTSRLVVYDIETDVLGLYNDISNPKIPKDNRVSPKNYLETLKRLTGYNTIIELYFNISSLNITYSDNLYRDNAYGSFRNKLEIMKQELIRK